MLQELDMIECDTSLIIGVASIIDVKGLQTRHLSQLTPQFLK
jgi:hypothetical protein